MRIQFFLIILFSFPNKTKWNSEELHQYFALYKNENQDARLPGNLDDGDTSRHIGSQERLTVQSFKNLVFSHAAMLPCTAL